MTPWFLNKNKRSGYIDHMPIYRNTRSNMPFIFSVGSDTFPSEKLRLVPELLPWSDEEMDHDKFYFILN